MCLKKLIKKMQLIQEMSTVTSKFLQLLYFLKHLTLFIYIMRCSLSKHCTCLKALQRTSSTFAFSRSSPPLTRLFNFLLNRHNFWLTFVIQLKVLQLNLFTLDTCAFVYLREKRSCMDELFRHENTCDFLWIYAQVCWLKGFCLHWLQTHITELR